MEADFIQCFHPSGSLLLLVRILLDYSRVYQAVSSKVSIKWWKTDRPLQSYLDHWYPSNRPWHWHSGCILRQTLLQRSHCLPYLLGFLHNLFHQLDPTNTLLGFDAPDRN